MKLLERKKLQENLLEEKYLALKVNYQKYGKTIKLILKPNRKQSTNQ